MRQLCNLSYAVQMEAFKDEDEFDAWQAQLPLHPREKPPLRAKRSQRRQAPQGSGLGFGGLGNV